VSANLTWPATNSSYTKYVDSFTSEDDGYTSIPVTLANSIALNNVLSDKLYLSTNGYFTIYAPNEASLTSPSEKLSVCGNPGDNYLRKGHPLNDSDVHNFFYKIYSERDRSYVKLLVYSGKHSNYSSPTSYILNFYRDTSYQWVETMVKSLAADSSSKSGPYNVPDVSRPVSTTSQVWKGSLNGTNWMYMGFGSVDN
jgi:hypothetical protein